MLARSNLAIFQTRKCLAIERKFRERFRARETRFCYWFKNLINNGGEMFLWSKIKNYTIILTLYLRWWWKIYPKIRSIIYVISTNSIRSTISPNQTFSKINNSDTEYPVFTSPFLSYFTTFRSFLFLYSRKKKKLFRNTYTHKIS